MSLALARDLKNLREEVEALRKEIAEFRAIIVLKQDKKASNGKTNR
jgi:hypothetical protein